MLRAQAHHGGDLRGRRRQHDAGGGPAIAVAPILREACRVCFILEHGVPAEQFYQRVNELHFGSFALFEGSKDVQGRLGLT
ncbi:hypothetical protein GmRootV512_28880 [Variovorax sp. V512]